MPRLNQNCRTGFFHHLTSWFCLYYALCGIQSIDFAPLFGPEINQGINLRTEINSMRSNQPINSGWVSPSALIF